MRATFRTRTEPTEYGLPVALRDMGRDQVRAATARGGKLVRDKIPEIIRGEGLEPVIYAADEQEYASRLRDKLQEEVAEFIASDNDPEEAAGTFPSALSRRSGRPVAPP